MTADSKIRTLADREKARELAHNERAEKTYTHEFQYTHRNPYHEKLEEFSEFVLRDHEGEALPGKWNQEVFKREAPLHIEIGSGYGHFMMDFCEKNPEVNFVGLDYRFKRTFELATKLQNHPTKNFRYLRAKGERIEFNFAENEVDSIYYFFPDPWPKARHHKKRLFQNPFLRAAYRILKPGGKLYIKTDHEGYADWMEEFIAAPTCQELFTQTLATRDLYQEFPDHYLAGFQTKFEKIFLKKGINIKAFVLESKKGQ